MTGCSVFSPCDTGRKSAPLRVEQSLHSSQHHYSTAFAFSCLFYLQNISAFLTVSLLGTFAPRIIQAYHVPQVVPTNGGRAPLYTGWVDGCVGLPIKTRRPAHHALLALEPNGGSSSALVTMRHTKALVTLSIPIISRGTSGVPLTVRTFTECLGPRRC